VGAPAAAGAKMCPMSAKKAKSGGARGRTPGGGGRVTESPWAARKAVANDLYDRLQSAGWVDATDDDVPLMHSGELPLTKVCTCSPDEVDELIARFATDPPETDQAVAVTLHDGPPVAVLIWPAG
jgi:hypothetical protein